MYINPRIPAVVGGKPVVLCFDAAAVVAMMEKYGMKLADLQNIGSKKLDTASELKLLMQLIYCMTRSNDEPTITEKEIQRLSVDEIVRLKGAIERTFAAGTERATGEIRRSTKTARSKRSRGIGAARSSRRSTSAASRRLNSGG